MAGLIARFEVDFTSSLGKGAYGTVYKAKHVDTEEPAAAKQMLIRSPSRDLPRIVQEVENMQAVTHPNLVKYLHHHQHSGTVWVFVELCNLGDLDKYFTKNAPDRQEYIHLMQQMATAIVFLHEKGVVHRDIKPGNILIKSGDQGGLPIVKICDFGLAKMIDLRNSAILSFSTMNIGTRLYMAPELIITSPGAEVRCNKLVDIFALGITFFAMLCFKKGASRLIPAEDGASCPDCGYGYEMQNFHKQGDLAKAINYHEEVVPIKGDDAEQMIREMIRKMIHFDIEERIEATVVLSDINDIILFLQTEQLKLEEAQADLKMLPNQMNSFTVTASDKVIHAVRSDLQTLTCAARVINFDKTELKVRVWDIIDDNDLCWRDRDLILIHTLNLESAPRDAGVIKILDKTLQVRVKLDVEGKSQIVTAYSSSGHVLHKSQVYPCDGEPENCIYKSQILLPDSRSSSITQLDAEKLNLLNTWKDPRAREPQRVSSNKNRAAVEDFFKCISVFKWENKELSHEMICTIDFDSCRAMQLLPDDTLICVNRNNQWSVWSESGAPVHTTVKHPALVPKMQIYKRFVQDPVSKECFVQEYGKAQDGSDCTVIYNIRLMINRLESGDKSQIDKSLVNVNKTINF